MHAAKSNKSIYVLILIIIIVTFAVLILWKPKFNTKSSIYDYYSITRDIADLKSKGGALELNSSEINSFLKLYFRDRIKYGNLTFKNIYTEIKNGFIYFYVPSSYKKINITISLICSLRLEDNKAIIKCNKLMIGELTVPDSIKNKTINGQISDGIYAQSGKVIIDFKNYPVKLASAYVSNDSVILKLNALTSSNSISNTSSKKTDTQEQIENSDSKNSSNILTEDNSKENSMAEDMDSNTDIVNTIETAKTNIGKSALSAKTAGGKEIINIIENIIDKVSKDPDYNYKSEEAFAIEKYYRLPPDEQEDVRNAILNNFDQSFLLKLINDFGI